MRRFLVFFTMTCAVFLIPAVSMAGNQEVAEYIVARLSEKFPANSIQVRYNSGEVTLSGEMNSPQQRNEALQYVASLRGVTKVNSPNLKIAEAVNRPLQVSSSVIAPERQIIPSEPMTIAAPLPVVNPILKQNTSGISPVSGTVETQQVQALMAPTPAPVPQNLPTGGNIGENEAPMQLAPVNSVPYQAYQQQVYSEQSAVYDGNQPLPMGVQNGATARYDQPNLPNYAWPTYAANPNYAQVAYPRNYSPQSAPYIGPFYPYPQVPLGWRKVTMEWHDGWWWLDFDDGTNKGPFSPLFRQPNPHRR
jgi:hypothetical protein